MDTNRRRKKQVKKTRAKPKPNHVFIGTLTGPRGGKSLDFVVDDEKDDAKLNLKRRNRDKTVKSVRRGVETGVLTQKDLDRFPKTKGSASFFSG